MTAKAAKGINWQQNSHIRNTQADYMSNKILDIQWK